MKLTMLLLTVTLLHAAARGVSQTVTYTAKVASVQEVFKAIKKQTGYVFFYRNEIIAGSHPVTVKLDRTPLKEALERILEDQPLQFDIQGNTIAILPKQAAQPVSTGNNAEKGVFALVTGQVTDRSGEPLAGVNVMVRGGRKGTITNGEGKFTLNVEPGQTLLFSFIGYAAKELRVTDVSKPLAISLEKRPSPLDEVQVIAYGTTTRRFATGSVSSITSDDIAKQSISNPMEALQGRIAGMQLTQDNGLPGSDVRVSIRGAGSTALYGTGYMPLYIVDGMPFTIFSGAAPPSDALNAFGISGGNGNMSPFSMINPADIERIDVLKDADATAIYGSRGANGVVMITTRKGMGSRTSLNLTGYQGIKEVGHFIPYMNTQQYLAMRREAFANANVTPTTLNALDLLTWDTTAYTNWEKYFIGGKAKTTSVTGSLSAGNAQNQLLMTSSYRNDGTVFPGNFSSLSFDNRLNAGHTSVNNKFNINLAVSYAYMGNNLPTTDLSSVINLPPDFPIYNKDGSQNWTLINPLSYLDKPYHSQTTNLITGVNMKYTVLPGLDLRANLGYTLTSLHQTAASPVSSQNPATASAATATLQYADNYNSNYIIEPQATYTRRISKGKLDLLAGTTFQQAKSTGVSLTGKGFSNDDLITSLTSASTVQVNYNNYSVYKYNAVFARANYDWDQKYIIDGTFRRDGSSRFGPGHKFGNFGAVGAAWIFTNEDFFKNLHFLSYGKLRGSYGITGNDQIANYQYFATANSGSSTYAYQGTSIYVQGAIANPDLHWESTKKLDAAMSLGFFGDRILLNADFYRNRTANRLVPVTLPSQSTGGSYYANIPSSVQNKGWEIELNTVNVKTKNFRWTTSLNFTSNRNKLLSYPGLANTTYRTVYYIGQPLDITQLYHFTGIDPNTGQPTIKSAAATPTITDRVIAPYGHPYYGGLVNSFTYRNFQLMFALQFNHRNGAVNNSISLPLGSSYVNQNTSALNRWEKPHDEAYLAAPTVTSNTAYQYYSSSDFNWGNTSFIKFKTLSFSYALPSQLIQKMGIRGLSVFAQGQNLYTWAKQKYTLDPETIPAGAGPSLGVGAYLAMPQLRTITFGLNCSL